MRPLEQVVDFVEGGVHVNAEKSGIAAFSIQDIMATFTTTYDVTAGP